MADRTDIKAARAALGEVLKDMRAGVAFTGAGISTECGIPDFRSPGGLWTRNRPIPLDEFLASRAMRTEAWRRRFAMEEAFGSAEPGRGHRAIARMLADGRLIGVVTQNIDGLHQASGVPAADLVELHGNSTYATCLDCDTRYELDWVRECFDAAGGAAPDCPDCGGPVKTATISFGQAMPVGEMIRARRMAQQCDVFLAIGSSLVVYPAAALPLEAKQAGATLVILNREPTDLDPYADLVIHADIGDVLDGLHGTPAPTER
ncbi:Sir2 family NAD-dependent protein deacetylase [Bosea sp. 117]|uniref:SIR2 family NAD-dependent protein deacylase n=1 Tax=Bosea sp. 117 TaxID=1125973 RepID=UPI00049435B4|nr:Sir2 family NAD-dependent protein deacetylase [Bosea sp. 117]